LVFDPLNWQIPSEPITKKTLRQWRVIALSVSRPDIGLRVASEELDDAKDLVTSRSTNQLDAFEPRVDEWSLGVDSGIDVRDENMEKVSFSSQHGSSVLTEFLNLSCSLGLTTKVQKSLRAYDSTRELGVRKGGTLGEDLDPVGAVGLEQGEELT
jgi:hypothetical protein